MTAAQSRALKLEVRRLQSAISAIHDHLHADRVNEAHEACECALAGGVATQPNLTMTDGARVMAFAAEFNELAARHRMNACWIGLVPSATTPNAVSMQLGGAVQACRIVEAQLRGAASTYMGEHGQKS